MENIMKFNLRWNDYYTKMIESFNGLRDSEEFMDVTLCLADGILKAHKAILSVSSPFLCAIFKEVPDDIGQVVQIRDITANDMRDILTFIYSGEVSVDHHDITRFMDIAKALEIRGLVEGGEKGLADAFRRKASQQAKKTSRTRRKPASADRTLQVLEQSEISGLLNTDEDDFPVVGTLGRHSIRRVKIQAKNQKGSKKPQMPVIDSSNTKKTIVQCTECDAVVDKRSLVRHLRVKHQLNKPPRPRMKLDRPKTKRKKTVITGAVVECRHCGMKMSRKSFKRHLTQKHEYVTSSDVWCPVCRKRYKHLEYMQEHCRTRHKLFGEALMQKLREFELENGSGLSMNQLQLESDSELRSESELDQEQTGESVLDVEVDDLLPGSEQGVDSKLVLRQIVEGVSELERRVEGVEQREKGEKDLDTSECDMEVPEPVLITEENSQVERNNQIGEESVTAVESVSGYC